MMFYAKIPYKSTIHLHRGSREQKENKRNKFYGVYTLVQKEDKHFLHNGWCTVCFDNNASEAESNYRYKEIEEGPEQNAEY